MNSNINLKKIINRYIDKTDWRVKENSSLPYSFQGLVLHTSTTIQSKYVLGLYPFLPRLLHKHGFIHIHDLGFGLAPYCSGWSLEDLLLEGFNLESSCSSHPPKHFDSALNQIVNFLCTLQNEWAGAQALNNVDVLLAPFIRFDNLTYFEVKQAIQKFIYNLNTTSRWGGQTPFTNLSFDVTPTKKLSQKPVIHSGKTLDYTYGEFQKEIDMFNFAFLEVMLDGDMNGRIFSYPIPNYNITKDFNWDNEVGQKLLEVTAKYGAPYFQNFINSDLDPDDIRSMCCRLRLDLTKLKKKGGGFFGSGDLTGSIGVVTLNLSKIAYYSKNNPDLFFKILHIVAKIAKDSLEFKRKLLDKFFDENFYPYTKRYLKSKFKNHFSTIGVISGAEACEKLLGEKFPIESEKGKAFLVKTLKFLSNTLEQFQVETGNLYNLEATPAEGASYRLAKIDSKKRVFSKFSIFEKNSNTKNAFSYTNSTLLKPEQEIDLFSAIDHQKDLQPIYTGGTVFHVFLGHEVVNLEALKKIIIKIFTETNLPTITITPTFSICRTHGYRMGKQLKCDICGQETEIYSRIVGYFRPISRWNTGKRMDEQLRYLYDDEFNH